MRPVILVFILVDVMTVPLGFGQGAILTGVGYADPTRILVAPGQITTLFVVGLSLNLDNPLLATTLPLPTSLGGISVTVSQAGHTFLAPLLGVQQLTLCNVGTGGTAPPGDCVLGAITLQVPWELSSGPNGNISSSAEVVVSQDGNASNMFTVLVAPDNLHVLTSCDVFPSFQPTPALQPITSPVCPPVVTHASGDLVSADDPAQPGEEIVIWALGLGPTSPTPVDGQPSPIVPATLSSPLYVQFDFRVNAAGSRPYVDPLSPTSSPTPTFAGLTPGQVGLYQINMRIPDVIPAVAPCGTTCSPVKCTIYNTVQSNMTIDIGANATFDGAAICVQPSQ